MLAHLQYHNAECPFTEVKCLYSHLGCNAVFVRYQLANHLENDCLYKVVDCPYCQVGFAGVKMQEHLTECGKFPVKCPHGCDDSEIPREKLPEHSKSCRRAPVQCNFSSMGCDFQGPRDSLDEHLSSLTTEHLTLSSIYMKKVLEEMQNLQQAINQTHEAQLTIQNEALALNKQTLSTHQVKLARMEESLEAHCKSFNEFRQRVDTMVNKENKEAGLNTNAVIQDERLAVLADEEMRINAAPCPHSTAREYERVPLPNVRGSDHGVKCDEHSLALHEIQLADRDLKLQMLECTSHDGVFLWKINKFQDRFREAVDGKTISIYSPPFYTSRYGYKLFARAYLNGDGPMAKGKYMSLFVVLMQGEYDGLLPWPFQQKITMMLLDGEQVPHITETFRPDPNSPSFQRPSSEMNIASGCPTFCSHQLLRSRRYVQDDAISIRIIVDGTGMLT